MLSMVMNEGSSMVCSSATLSMGAARAMSAKKQKKN